MLRDWLSRLVNRFGLEDLVDYLPDPFLWTYPEI